MAGYAQQNDTLKHNPATLQQRETEDLKINREALETIKNEFLIGPMPERKRPVSYSENELMEIKSRKQNMENRDSIQALQFSDNFIKQLVADSKIHHKKTTVNDTQTLANPHIKLSFDDILCYIFRPDFRAKMRNKKHVSSYKNF